MAVSWTLAVDVVVVRDVPSAMKVPSPLLTTCDGASTKVYPHCREPLDVPRI